MKKYTITAIDGRGNVASICKVENVTPVQHYAMRIITAIEHFLANGDEESREAIQNMIMERPLTLRAALSAYLYRSQMAQITRKTSKYSQYYRN